MLLECPIFKPSERLGQGEVRSSKAVCVPFAVVSAGFCSPGLDWGEDRNETLLDQIWCPPRIVVGTPSGEDSTAPWEVQRVCFTASTSESISSMSCAHLKAGVCLLCGRTFAKKKG